MMLQNKKSRSAPWCDLALVGASLVAVAALYGGLLIDHLPRGPLAEASMVVAGMTMLLLAALWLDHRDAARGAPCAEPIPAAAEPPPGARAVRDRSAPGEVVFGPGD